jgi:hypothetical protein
MTKLTINTEIKASARAIGIALFNGLLPQRETIGNRNFRTLLLDRIGTEINSGSAPTVYNHAKQNAITLELTPDFSRSVGEKIGSVQELDEAVETEIHTLFDTLVAQAHTDAQQADLTARQEKADKEAEKQAAKDAKAKERDEAKAKRDEEAKAEKEAKQKKREEAKAQKAQEKADAKAAKDKEKADAKANAKKVAEEQPEMKWQLVNKETNEVVEYAPDRKVGLELKKKREDADQIKVVKIPAVA